jgi:4-alpha-glucanotransferase
LSDRFALPGMRVLQFAFDGGSGNPHLPANYTHNTVVYTGTHDNPTTRAWFESLPDWQQQNVWNYLKRPSGVSEESAPALIELAWNSAAALAIMPLQDLLNFGSDARMNQPGRAEGNWQWRCIAPMLTPAVWQWLRELTIASNRVATARRVSETCPCRKSDPTVFMMESAEDGLCNDVTKAVDRTRKRRVLSQSEMRPDMVVIGSISLENLTQMGLAKDHDVIQAFSTDRANQPLGMPILPG